MLKWHNWTRNVQKFEQVKNFEPVEVKNANYDGFNTLKKEFYKKIEFYF